MYRQFRGAQCPLFLPSCKLLLQGLLVPVEFLQPFMVIDLCLAIGHLKLPFQFPNLGLYSPQFPFHFPGCFLFQTLEVRGGISGTHGYTVLIKTTQWNSINTNKTQYLFRSLVPRRLVTHLCSPSCYCQIDL